MNKHHAQPQQSKSDKHRHARTHVRTKKDSIHTVQQLYREGRVCSQHLLNTIFKPTRSSPLFSSFLSPFLHLSLSRLYPSATSCLPVRLLHCCNFKKIQHRCSRVPNQRRRGSAHFQFISIQTRVHFKSKPIEQKKNYIPYARHTPQLLTHIRGTQQYNSTHSSIYIHNNSNRPYLYLRT